MKHNMQGMTPEQAKHAIFNLYAAWQWIKPVLVRLSPFFDTQAEVDTYMEGKWRHYVAAKWPDTEWMEVD